MATGWAGPWRKCEGMNKDGKCRAGRNHLLHKKHWLGGWYAQVPAPKAERDKLEQRLLRPKGQKLSTQKPKKKGFWS